MAEKPQRSATDDQATLSDVEATKENVGPLDSTLDVQPIVEVQYCTYPPLTPEDVALTKMVDLQKMGLSHKILPVAPDGFIPNSEVRKLYKPIDTSQQLVPIGATKLDIEAILRKQKTLSKELTEDDLLQKSLLHYMNDEKMREVSFADAVVDAPETQSALAQRINSDEIRRDILDTFYENLDKEFGAVKVSSVARRRPRLDGKDLRAEKRAKLLQEKRRKLAEAASSRKEGEEEEASAVDSMSEGSSLITGREDTMDFTITSEMAESFDQMVPLEDNLDNLPFEERMLRMFDMLIAELGSPDAVYHMASRVLEEDPKAWYHMKMALSKNERIRYFVDGLRQPRFACDFLISMFGSVVKMMDTIEGALDGTIEDTRLLRLMLNSQEKTEMLLTEFGKARTLAQVILTEIVPPTKNTHFLLRDALRCYTGAIETLAGFVDDDIDLTERLLRCVMTCNTKNLLKMRHMIVNKGGKARTRYEQEAAAAAAAAAAAPSPEMAIPSPTLTITPTDVSESLGRETVTTEVDTTEKKKPKDKTVKRRRTIKRKLPPLPKFSEAAWKAHLANRLNAAIEVCAETAAMKQVAVALKLSEGEEMDDATQANAQGLIMSVFESRMAALQALCDNLGDRMSSEALLNSALNMQRETLNAFLNSFEPKEIGLQLVESLFQVKHEVFEKLMISCATDDPNMWQPIDGIDRMLRFSNALKDAMTTEIIKLKDGGLDINAQDVHKCLDTLMLMDEGTVNAINDCIMANRHPMAFQSNRLARVDSLKFTSPVTDQLSSMLTANKKVVCRILASSYDSIHRTEREQKAEMQIDSIVVRKDREVTVDFLQRMACRFDTIQLLHRLERDRNKVLDFVRAQGPSLNLIQVYEAMDKVESLLQKAQRMTKVTIRLQEESVGLSQSIDEGDEVGLQAQIHKILKQLSKSGIDMAMAVLDEGGTSDSFRRLGDALDLVPVNNGLQGIVDFMNSDEWKSMIDACAQPMVNEVTGTLRHMTRLTNYEETNLVKKCLLLQAQRMVLATEKAHRSSEEKEKFEGNPAAKAVYEKLTEILQSKEPKKAILKALKELLLTDEFKAAFEEAEQMVTLLKKKMDVIPNVFVQLIRGAVTELKGGKPAKEKKRREKGPSIRPADKQISSGKSIRSDKRGKASPQPSSPVVSAVSKPSPAPILIRPRVEEAESPAPSQPESFISGEPSERSERSAQDMLSTSRATSVQLSSGRDKIVHVHVTGGKPPIPVPLKAEKVVKVSEEKLKVEDQKKLLEKEEEKVPYFEPLEMPPPSPEISSGVKPKLKPKKKPKAADKAREKEEEEERMRKLEEELLKKEKEEREPTELQKVATVDQFTKEELRTYVRDMVDEEARLKGLPVAGKKPIPPSLDELSKEKVSSICPSEETEESSGFEVDIDKGAAMIGDLQWISDVQEPTAVETAAKEAGKVESKEPITTTSEAKGKLSSLSDKDDGFRTDDAGVVRIIDDYEYEEKTEDEARTLLETLHPSAVRIPLHTKADRMPKVKPKKKGKKGRPKVEIAMVLPSEETIEALKREGLTPQDVKDQINQILLNVTSHSWYKSDPGKPLTINNVCRSLCEMLNTCKKPEVFSSICSSLELIHNKIAVPQRVAGSVINFFMASISAVNTKVLPDMVCSIEKLQAARIDPLTMRRKMIQAQNKAREAFIRATRMMQTMDQLGFDTRGMRLELRKYFLSLFPTPGLSQTDIDKMTDEELEEFLKQPEVLSHEMRPPNLDQKLSAMAKTVQRTGEMFGRETDAYGGGGGGGGGFAPSGGFGGAGFMSSGPMVPGLSGVRYDDADAAKLYKPIDEEVHKRAADMDRQEIPRDGFDAEEVAKRELEFQRSMFRFSDEKPFKGIVAEADLPLQDLAYLQREEAKQKLRVVDIDGMGREKFFEDDLAYRADDIRKLPGMQLSPEEQAAPEKLLPGEELDYGDRRVISLCKSPKLDDGKQKKSADRSDTISTQSKPMEAMAGSRRVVHPMEQLQLKKDKKHKPRKERPPSAKEGEAEKRGERVRKIEDIGWGEERPKTKEERARLREEAALREHIREQAEERAKAVLMDAREQMQADKTPFTTVEPRVTPVSTPSISDKTPSPRLLTEVTSAEEMPALPKAELPEERTVTPPARTTTPTVELKIALGEQKVADARKRLGGIVGIEEEDRTISEITEEGEESAAEGVIQDIERAEGRVLRRTQSMDKKSIDMYERPKEAKEKIEIKEEEEKEKEKPMEKMEDEAKTMKDFKVAPKTPEELEEEQRLRRMSRKKQFRRAVTEDYTMPLRARDLLEKLICTSPTSLTVQSALPDVSLGAAAAADVTAGIAGEALTSPAALTHPPQATTSPYMATLVATGEVDATLTPEAEAVTKRAAQPKPTFSFEDMLPVSASVKHKAVQENSKLLKKVLAIPTMQKAYKPSFSVMSRLPRYLKPEVIAEMAKDGRNAIELSKVAVVAEGIKKKTTARGIGGGPALTKEYLPAYSDPMFRPPSPVSLPYLPDRQAPASAAQTSERQSETMPTLTLTMKKPDRIIPPTPPCNRPSYVTPHDWGRIAISREAWKTGKYSFTPQLEPNRHCLFDQLCAKRIQAYGVEVGKHLVRCDLVKMIHASINESARERIEKRLIKSKRDLAGNSSIAASSQP